MTDLQWTFLMEKRKEIKDLRHVHTIFLSQVQVTEVDPLEGSSQSLEESNQTSRGRKILKV